MKIALLNNYTQEPDCTHWKGTRKAIKWLGHELCQVDVRATKPEQQLAALAAFDPELIIYGIDDVIYSGVYTAIREKFTCPIFMWYCELRNEETGGTFDNDLEKYIDILFLTNDGQEDYYKKKNKLKQVKYLPQAGNPVDIPFYHETWAYDAVFIGTKESSGFWGRRDQFLEVFRRSGLKFEHINGGTPAEKMMWYQRMSLIYGSSKICLDISHAWHVRKYCSNRYYVIPSRGGFSLTKRFPGCEEQYPEGVGKVYFDTTEEMLEKANYYLAHEDERHDIRLKGLEHCKQNHTYIHRIKEMLSYV